MTDYEYLIHLIYCAVHDTQPAGLPEGVSFKTVLEMGKIHEVANIAFISVQKLAEKPDAQVYRDWQMSYFFSVQRDVRQQELYTRISELMHRNGIRTLEAQGTVTKTLYPSPEWRMMSDIDFIIDKANLEKAREILRTEGFEILHTSDEEFDAVDSGLEVEFHTDFFTREIYDREANFAKAVNNAFLHAAPDKGNPMKYILEDTYFYLFSVLHTIKHFETAGCGIRRILDLYYLKNAYSQTIDMALVESIIAQYGFKASYDTLFQLEAMWFEGIEPNQDMEGAVRTVLMSGNHGTRTVYSKNEIRRERRNGANMPALRRIMRFVFPTREWMYANYPVCKERGYSAFVCWFYRLFYKVKNGNLKPALQYIRHMLHAKH